MQYLVWFVESRQFKINVEKFIDFIQFVWFLCKTWILCMNPIEMQKSRLHLMNRSINSIHKSCIQQFEINFEIKRFELWYALITQSNCESFKLKSNIFNPNKVHYFRRRAKISLNCIDA